VLLDRPTGEQSLDVLSRSGNLGRFRYLQPATHGLRDRPFLLRLRLQLSRDRLPMSVSNWQPVAIQLQVDGVEDPEAVVPEVGVALPDRVAELAYEDEIPCLSVCGRMR